MKITILGWYGTETVGDRAILAGIFHLFSLVLKDEFCINFGSLFCPLTERTWYEDKDFYAKISEGKVKLNTIFYSLDKSELQKNIKNSDIVIIGGGPLMDNIGGPMYMLKYAFRYAKKHGIKTMALGCGWGGLKTDEYIKLAKEIIELSDTIIFRDSTSVTECLKHTQLQERQVPVGLIDPAFFAAQYYRQHRQSPSDNSHISMNLRDGFVVDEVGKNKFTVADCIDIIKQLIELQMNVPIRLIPMHTFHFGCDDRGILNKVAQEINNPSIIVQNEPLSLEQTMQVYYDSALCIGMRFHSILLQTVLNGKNYIMDYTEAVNGKTINLIRQLNLQEKFNDRYVSCENIKRIKIRPDIEKIIVSDETIDSYENQYIAVMHDAINK